jgi:hypothetical protein
LAGNAAGDHGAQLDAHADSDAGTHGDGDTDRDANHDAQPHIYTNAGAPWSGGAASLALMVCTGLERLVNEDKPVCEWCEGENKCEVHIKLNTLGGEFVVCAECLRRYMAGKRAAGVIGGPKQKKAPEAAQRKLL